MKDAIDYVFSSKTLIFIFMMTVLLVLAFVVVSAAINAGLQVPVTADQLIDAWKWATGAGTARNVISDGVAPRMAQTVGAMKDPSVANLPVRPMESTVESVTEAAAPTFYVPPANPPSTVVQHVEE